MTKKEIASLACKILAVYALLQIPQYLHGVWIILSYIFSEMYREYTADVTNFLWNFSTTLVPVLLYLIAGILLWRRSN
ncbi:MAG: hypothetical protein SVV80_06810, partial [Planctomycetota bacterium]|nr:hypothetical protein [Planctomycetota bacterium]